jgi:hypothetical protein
MRARWPYLALILATGACSGRIGANGPGLGSGAAGASNPAGTGNSGGPGVGGAGAGGAGAGTGTGSSGGPGAGGATTPTYDATFACNANTAPPVATLRRLTMSQFRNTVSDLAAWALASASGGATVMTEIASSLSELPDDKREAVPQDLHGSYRRLDQSLQQTHVDSTYDVAVALGAALTTTARLGTVVGTCATDTSTTNDATCLDTFIKKFGARALRHPLSTDEVSFYTMAYGSSTTASAAAYADLIGLFVTAPEFMYFVEHGDTAVSGQTGVYDVSPYELASRLSYQLWQTAPDDALLAAAADGSLRDAATYNAQVTRMLADARARPALDEFFADWMKVEDLPAMDAKNADPTFKTFAGADLPDSKLRQAMIDDVVGMLDYFTWTTPSGLQALLTSDLSFARDARLAKLYGASAWSGGGAPPMLPAGQRPGLLTRALFLSTGSANTRPIMKGVFVRTNILCDSIPPPPPGANAKPPELGPNMTTRESVEALTEMPGTVCASCHAPVINPLGFATEGFDSLGRFRTAQRLFDANGVETGSKPVDTMTVPQVISGAPTAISTPAELMSLMLSSGKLEACLSRNFFRYTYGRWEDPATDGCALEDARKALAGGGTIADLAAAVVKTAEFKRRTFQ